MTILKDAAHTQHKQVHDDFIFESASPFGKSKMSTLSDTEETRKTFDFKPQPLDPRNWFNTYRNGKVLNAEPYRTEGLQEALKENPPGFYCVGNDSRFLVGANIYDYFWRFIGDRTFVRHSALGGWDPARTDGVLHLQAPFQYSNIDPTHIQFKSEVFATTGLGNDDGQLRENQWCFFNRDVQTEIFVDRQGMQSSLETAIEDFGRRGSQLQAKVAAAAIADQEDAATEDFSLQYDFGGQASKKEGEAILSSTLNPITDDNPANATAASAAEVIAEPYEEPAWSLIPVPSPVSSP